MDEDFEEDNSETGYKCEYCPRTFRTEGSRTRHIKKEHQKEVREESIEKAREQRYAAERRIGRAHFQTAVQKVDAFIAEHDLVCARNIPGINMVGRSKGVTIAHEGYFDSISSSPEIEAIWEAETQTLSIFRNIDYDWCFTAYFIPRQGFKENVHELNRALRPRLQACGIIPRAIEEKKPVISKGLTAYITYNQMDCTIRSETTSHLVLRTPSGEVRAVAKDDIGLQWETLFYVGHYG